MNTLIKKSLLSSSTALLALSLVASSAVYAGDHPVAGGWNVTYTTQNVIPVDERGHMLVQAIAEGSNKSTLNNNHLDGWTIVNKEMADLTQGNGPHNGYIDYSNGSDIVTAAWSGNVSTVMSPEGTPQTSFAGEWQYTGGTGPYANIKGSGTYSGHFVSQTEYVVDWKGFSNK